MQQAAVQGLQERVHKVAVQTRAFHALCKVQRCRLAVWVRHHDIKHAVHVQAPQSVVHEEL